MPLPHLTNESDGPAAPGLQREGLRGDGVQQGQGLGPGGEEESEKARNRWGVAESCKYEVKSIEGRKTYLNRAAKKIGIYVLTS